MRDELIVNNRALAGDSGDLSGAKFEIHYGITHAEVTTYFAYSIPGTDVFVYTADGVSFNVCFFCAPGTQFD